MLQCYRQGGKHRLQAETQPETLNLTFSLLYLLVGVRLCVGVCVSRSAKEAEEKIKKALDKGEVLPTEARFDSNCITPGKEDLKLHAKMLITQTQIRTT